MHCESDVKGVGQKTSIFSRKPCSLSVIFVRRL